ncbi:MAG: antibiotic biosynthesis monooxygenase [Saprospiraceae bacterium]|nr:MAG: antibiotic biosynthesis monooxygenase [Saprospiraceae bacterium]
MIKRIVKLTFRPEEIDNFLAIFETKKEAIRQFPGCQHLELWRNLEPDNIFFTYSYWDAEADLEAYRHSELFKTTWKATKVLFDGKPEAWSVAVAFEG